MKKLLLLAAAVGLVGSIGPSFAAQNVANTSQKGSLLVWPLITVEHNYGRSESTVIEISNDANTPIHVECYYVNERKGRVDFDFHLTGKQTVSWDVYTGDGDQVTPPPFPTHIGRPQYPRGSVYKGELICFATNFGREYQVAWNHLTGTATVLHNIDRPTDSVIEPVWSPSAFKYNAWAFSARSDTGLAPDNQSVSHGPPGLLRLHGLGAGTYDACPAYNIANFNPAGGRIGNLLTISNSLAVSGCWQDLRQAYTIYRTKLDFTVWNAFEHSFTGAHVCVDSVTHVKLAPSFEPKPNEHVVTNGTNFLYDVLRTPNARFQVRGVKSIPPCALSYVTGLLGVLYSKHIFVGFDWTPAITLDPLSPYFVTGNTLHSAGVLPGFVKWDVAPPVGSRPNRT